MRVIALLGCAVSIALAIAGCYHCDAPGQPRCPATQPDYPPPPPLDISRPRDAGRG